MKHLLHIVILLAIQIALYSQSGPGGVGNASNNGLWLRADGLSQANNSTISSWTDQSGNSNNAGQSLTPKQPIYLSSSTLNNMPIVRFDGNNDEMVVPDANILDGTSGITYYAVIKPNNLNGAPRGILGKRVSYTNPTEYAYTWFFWNSNQMDLDVNTQNNRFNTGATTFTNGTKYILSWEFNGALPSAQRSMMRSGSTLIAQSTETSTVITNSNQVLAIGALNAGYGTYLGADYGEIIQYNYAINAAQHTIVQNYLSAKYEIPLASNDIYVMDNPANGNFDFDVAGIGKVSASEFNNDAQGSGIVRMLNPTGLDNNEYYIWGHDNGTLGSYGSTDYPPGLQGRLIRVWRGNEVDLSGNAVDVGAIDVRFDLTGLGTVVASELVLLVDSDNDGIFADEIPIGGAVNVSGNIFEFSGVTALKDQLRFTLGTSNRFSTPLPIELISFDALQNKNTVDLNWTTASEINNDYFTIERSPDAINWDEIATVNGAGNSTSTINYSETDNAPLNGINYYRLKQTNYDGASTYSQTVAVNFKNNDETIEVYPNPNDGKLININLKQFNNKKVSLIIHDITGKALFSETINNSNGQYFSIQLDEKLAKGSYIIIISSENEKVSKKLIVE